MSIRVGVVDNHKLFRTSFSLFLNQVDRVEVVFQCSNGIELLEVLKSKEVDIVFLDVQMPVMDGFVITPKLNDKYPDLKIIILSSFNDPYTIERMLKYNISGYLTKNVSQSQVKKAIYSVFEGEVYYDSQISVVVDLLQDENYKKEVGLTPKEVEIIKLFVKQYSGRQIADKLHLSVRTVEKHKEIIMQKTGASNFIGVIVYAILRHYITEDDLV